MRPYNTPPLKERKYDIRKIFLLHCKCLQKQNYTLYLPTVYMNTIILSSEDRDLTHTTVNTHMSKHILTSSKYSGHVINTMIHSSLIKSVQYCIIHNTKYIIQQRDNASATRFCLSGMCFTSKLYSWRNRL